MKILRNWSETRNKISLNYNLLLLGKNFHLDNAFLEIVKLKASLEESQQLQQKDMKRRKRNGGKKLKNLKSPVKTYRSLSLLQKSRNFDFCACLKKCPKKRCLWKERQAVMLQITF